MALEIRRPRVAMISFSFLMDQSLAQRRTALSLDELQGAGLEIVSSASVRSPEEARSAACDLHQLECDLVILAFSDWVREDLPILVGREVHAPILLWGIVGDSAYLPLAGVTCAASNLRRIGVPFKYIVGEPESQRAIDEIRCWARAAAAVKSLRSLRLGMVGLGCPGLISTGTSEISLRRLGPELIALDPLRLLAEYEQVGGDAASRQAERFRDPVFHFDGATEADLLAAIRLYTAIKTLVSQENLDAIGIRCWPELRTYQGLSPCVAFSLLMDEGVMGSCENDPLAGVAMALGYWLTGQPVFSADINTVVEKDRLLKVWHCGAASLGLRASDRVEVRKTFHDSSGCTLEFPLMSGSVTLFKISRPLEGTCRMLVASGEVTDVAGDVRGNAADVRLDVPASQFVDALVGGGFGHHIVLAYGAISDELEKISDLLGLELVRASSEKPTGVQEWL